MDHHHIEEGVATISDRDVMAQEWGRLSVYTAHPELSLFLLAKEGIPYTMILRGSYFYFNRARRDCRKLYCRPAMDGPVAKQPVDGRRMHSTHVSTRHDCGIALYASIKAQDDRLRFGGQMLDGIDVRRLLKKTDEAVFAITVPTRQASPMSEWSIQLRATYSQGECSCL